MPNSYICYAPRYRQALARPQFFIEHRGKLYLTVGVLEFDEKHPEASEEQKEVIRRLRKALLDDGALADASVYDAPPETKKLMAGPPCANTEPPCSDEVIGG